jgi:NADH-quinone oxidoreductase subunit F
MVDVARYFIEFTHSESCGKCVPCRVGLDKALRILNQFTQGKGTEEDLNTLDELGRMIRDTSLCGLGQTAPNPVLTTMRHFHHEFEDHIKAHRCRAGVCQELALSPCENSCPLHMNIPRFLELYKEGRLDDAFESVILDNPLPASTGRVCQHPCDNRCRRHSMDEAVNMREVHRGIADSIFLSDRFEEMAARVAARRMPPTGKKIAVVGAGPTGLTAAFYLTLFGHEVTVYESHEEAGGMLRYALPEYRLPKAVLAKEIDLIRRLGVKFEFNKSVGTDVSLNELGMGFDAVFLSIGTWKEAWVYLPGTELKGVMPALLFLEGIAKNESVPLGQRVAIIGGGNAAIDSARTALRRGATVTVIYRRERKDMPAIQEEVEAAEQEGAHFVFLAAPHRIVGENGSVKAVEVLKTRLGEFDASGRRRPISTEEIQSFKCDTVILAVGEAVDKDFCKASGLSLTERGTLEFNRYTMETSREKFYAGGDVISGASNVSNAMGYGKKAARFIDQRLMEEVRAQGFLAHFEYDRTPPEQVSESGRHHHHPLPPKQRVKDFCEAVLPLTAAEALEEASRCLRCDVKSSG